VEEDKEEHHTADMGNQVEVPVSVKLLVQVFELQM
jgi:hypothetical protein